MKPEEFNKIKEDFDKAQKRWESINVGDKVYEEDIWQDTFEGIVQSIDVNERVVTVLDKSESMHPEGKVKEWSHFMTLPEAEKHWKDTKHKIF